MKRDFNVIREILLHVESLPRCGWTQVRVDKDGNGDADRVAHTALLIKAGLLEGEPHAGSSGQVVACTVWGLTWSGHEFLDNSRMGEKAWNKAASKISEGHSFSFSFLSEFFAKAAAEAAVNILKM